MKEFLKIKKSKAICWITSDRLLLYKKGSFYIYDLTSNETKFVAKMDLSSKQKIFNLNKLFRRSFRLYPQTPLFINKTHEVLFSFIGSIYCLNLNNKSITKEIDLSYGARRVLSICLDKNNDAYFGEYPVNGTDGPIRIFKRNANKEWNHIYSFEKDSIRHIHFVTVNDNDFYCFTGDEDNQCKMVCFKNMNFTEPMVIAEGKQKYRTCFASFDKDENFYYLTDSPYYQNKLNLCQKDGTVTELENVDGSVIYGLNEKENFYFATCVEPNLAKDKENNNVKIKIDGSNGGIRSKNAKVYQFNKVNKKLSLVYELKKDNMPAKFGICTFIFTSNESDEYLAFTSSCTKKD